MRYVVKRLLSLIPVLFVVSILVFSLMHLAPGDPASAILGMKATAADLEHLKEGPNIQNISKIIRNYIYIKHKILLIYIKIAITKIVPQFFIITMRYKF